MGQSSIVDDLHLQWRVERLIGVFLCSEAFWTFKPVQECNRRVEEAFQALERAVHDALPPLEGVGSKQSAVGRRRHTVDSKQ